MGKLGWLMDVINVLIQDVNNGGDMGWGLWELCTTIQIWFSNLKLF